jgi:hypothetical protein
VNDHGRLDIVWPVILTDLVVGRSDIERGTGWAIKPEGACKAEVCVPLPPDVEAGPGRVDVARLAERLGMPLVHDEDHGLWALGPEAGVSGRALTTATASDLELPDLDGNPFRLSSLLGKKVLLVAWASW